MSTTKTQILYVGADNLIRVDGFADATDGSYLNAATVTGVLKDSLGVAVPGADSITFAYVAASNGRYEGTIASTVSLTVDASYSLEITLVEGAVDDFRVIPCVAKNRALT